MIGTVIYKAGIKFKNTLLLSLGFSDTTDYPEVASKVDKKILGKTVTVCVSLYKFCTDCDLRIVSGIYPHEKFGMSIVVQQTHENGVSESYIHIQNNLNSKG